MTCMCLSLIPSSRFSTVGLRRTSGDEIEKNADGVVIAKEVVNQKLKLRKMKYTEDCIRNGEMNNPGNDDERIHAITSLQESLHQLEMTSPLEEVRDHLATTLRKYLSSLNWQHLHCLCVLQPTSPH